MKDTLPPAVLLEVCKSVHSKNHTPATVIDVDDDASWIAVDPAYTQPDEANTAASARPSTKDPIKPFDLAGLPLELQVMVFDEIVLTAISDVRALNNILALDNILTNFRAGNHDRHVVSNLLDVHFKSLAAFGRVMAVDMSFALQIFDSIYRLYGRARGKLGVGAEDGFDVRHWEEVLVYARNTLVEAYHETIVSASNEEIEALKRPAPVGMAEDVGDRKPAFSPRTEGMAWTRLFTDEEWAQPPK